MALAESDIEILLELEDGVARPGQTLRGGFRLKREETVHAKRVEASCLWYTEGRGDMDEGVIWHNTFLQNDVLNNQTAFPIEVLLPDQPWSYTGKLIKIKWSVRVRIFPEEGNDVAAELLFKMEPRKDS